MLVADMHVYPESRDFQDVGQAPIGMVVEFVYGITDMIISKLSVAQIVTFIPVEAIQGSAGGSFMADVSRQ